MTAYSVLCIALLNERLHRPSACSSPVLTAGVQVEGLQFQQRCGLLHHTPSLSNGQPACDILLCLRHLASR